MDKNKEIKVANIFLKATDEQYKEMKGAYNHSYYLRTQEEESEIEVVSLDALAEREFAGVDVIRDDRTNVEEDAIHNVMLEKMRKAQECLTDEENILIDMYYFQNISQDEMEKTLDIPQSTISYRIQRAIKKMRKFMGIKLF